MASLRFNQAIPLAIVWIARIAVFSPHAFLIAALDFERPATVISESPNEDSHQAIRAELFSTERLEQLRHGRLG